MLEVGEAAQSRPRNPGLKAHPQQSLPNGLHHQSMLGSILDAVQKLPAQGRIGDRIGMPRT